MSKITRIATYKPVLANAVKKELVTNPLGQYKYELQQLVTNQMYQTDIKKFAGKDVTDTIKLPARLSQVCAKQASAIVRSIQAKVKLAQQANNTQKYQQEILAKWNQQSLSVNINSVNIELDSRFIEIQPNETSKISTHWIKITSFPSGSFFIPFTPTCHMKDLEKRGFAMKINAIRVNSDGSLGIYFVKDVALRPNQGVVGVDMGRNKIVTCSNGQMETCHKTSRPIKQVLEVIARRKQNSKAHARARQELKNQINYSIKNNIPWDEISHLAMEDLSEIKQGNKWGRTHQFWRVGYAQQRIEHSCEENGVRLTRVNAAYTSQTCSACGIKHKRSRQGERFSCLSCGYEIDADLNGAINIRNRGAYSPSVRKI
jgi:transposase